MGVSKAAEYFKIYRFMAEGLGLTGIDLLLYARIFHFCKLEGGSYYESKPRAADFLGTTDRQIRRSMKRLIEAGLVHEVGEARVAYGRITKRYGIDKDAVKRAVAITKRLHWTGGGDDP